MTSRDFCYWLQGYFEVSGSTTLDKRATEAVKRHLALVFVHEIDPSMGDKAEQDKLNAVHVPTPPVTTAGEPWQAPQHGDKILRC